MTNKDFKEGMEVSCELDNVKADDASLKQEGRGNWYIHATHNGILQDWWIGDGSDLERHGVTNLQPKHRTIDDLECGDYVVDGDETKKKCLGKIGEVYLMSEGDDENEYHWYKVFGFGQTLYELKQHGYTLYQPAEPEEVKETDIDRCIKVVEEYFGKDYHTSLKIELVQALKELRQERNKLSD